MSANPAHRSFFRARLQQLAGAQPVDDWLVDEANVRGYLGAVGLTIPDRTPTLRVSDEEIVVALLMPHASVDGRVFKLIVRLLQRTSLDAKSLWFLARRERADRVLYWLSHSVPQSERAGSIVPLLACCPGPPRGYQGLRFNYDASRLIRRVATKESVWKAARR